MGTQRGAREGTNPDELLVDEGFNAILGGIIQKKFGLINEAIRDGGISSANGLAKAHKSDPTVVMLVNQSSQKERKNRPIS